MNLPPFPARGWRCATRTLPVLAAFAVAAVLPVDVIAQTEPTAPGDPILTLARVFPKTATWRATTAIGFTVDIQHPQAGRGLTLPPWWVAPPGGWGSALRLVVTDASGTTVPWPFQLSAPKRDQPLVVSALLNAGAALAFDPRTNALPIPPGTYTVRAELAANAGAGWRGRVVSNPLAVTVLDRIGPQLQLEPIVAGPLVPGWPWGVLMTLSLPAVGDARTLQIPGHSRDWPTNAQLVVRNAQGVEVAWNWVPARLPVSDDRWLDPGETFGPAYLRLPTNATAALPAGPYTVTARFATTLKHPVFDYWNGVIESQPLAVTVEPAPAHPDVAALARKYRLTAEDALEEAAVIRITAAEIGVSTDRRLELTRQAATPLLRAESAGQQWLLLEPASPGPAALLSRILMGQDDKTEAAAWAQTALDLDAANPVVDPELPPGSPPRDPGLPNLFVLQQRQQVDALPEVPSAQLTPELQFALNLARGTLPEPTNVVEQDKQFTLDPRGQWAVAARASSEYRTTTYSAARATGAPDVQFYGDNGNSWATKLADAPDEWIELTFGQPVRAAAVRVRQNYNPGAIVRVDLIDAEGTVQTAFQGVDTNAYPRATIGWFVLRFPTTAKPIARVKITLDSVTVRGWNEIDAVQLVAGVVTPVTPPRLVLAPRSAGAMALEILDWPEGFVLERATRVAPADWQRYADRPPATLPLGSTAEFFRLAELP